MKQEHITVSIYEKCPVLENKIVTLRLINDEDTMELLNCYSDERSVPLFNSDNCNGDDFYYKHRNVCNRRLIFGK